MTTHSKTTASFALKSEQYLKEDCDGPSFALHFAVSPLIGNVSDQTVLCVGCGAGAECTVLSNLGAHVSGVDPSPTLLENARTNCPSVKFEIASAEKLPFPGKSFDIVYCAHVLHYIDDWSAALSEMGRVLKPDGRMIVTIHHPIDYGLTDNQCGTRSLGFDKGKETGHYLGRREVHATWYKDFEVVFYPRSIAEMLNSFIKAGFRVKSCAEAGSAPDSELPIFIAFELDRG